MTRLFREGRTETVRSCSNESCAFIRAFEGGEVGIIPHGNKFPSSDVNPTHHGTKMNECDVNSTLEPQAKQCSVLEPWKMTPSPRLNHNINTTDRRSK